MHLTRFRFSLFPVIIVFLLTIVSCKVQNQDTVFDTELPADGWMLYVNATGPVWLSRDWWTGHGVDSSAFDYEDVRLQHEGTDVPYLWYGEGEERGLLFLADVKVTRDGLWGSYTLEVGKSGKQIPNLQLPPVEMSTCQTTTHASLVLEENHQYRSTAPLAYPWFWTALRPPESITLTIPLTRSLMSPVTVTTQIWGQSRMIQEPDHHIRLIWDDIQTEDRFWDGNELEKWQTVFTHDGSSGAKLVIASPGETEAPVELNWLDRIDVVWRKKLETSDSTWEQWIAEAQPYACVLNARHEDMVALLRKADGSIFQADIGVNGIPQESGMVGWIGVPATASVPNYTRPRVIVSEETLSVIDYLVLAPSQLHQTLAPLLDKRTAEGFTVFLMSPEQVYDTYGTGLPDSAAIHEMVTYLSLEGKLRYVLLAGDTSVGASSSASEMFQHIPTGWERTTIVGETSSDFALVRDKDGAPVVAIGRFPSNDVDAIASMVDKTVKWAPNDRMIFVRDDEVEFDRFLDLLAEVSPPVSRISAGEENARDLLLAWLREDTGILVYSGHGSLPMLGDEKILTREDAGTWDESTVVIAWSCLCASFTHPTYEGLGESWMSASKGTVAFVGPTGETTSTQQAQMAVAVQKAIVNGKRIGDALLDGWQTAQSFDAQVSFLLLGDPAMQPFADRSQ